MSHTPGTHGEVFLDARGHGRAMRLTWHHEVDVVVLSLWREDVCAGTFRLSTADVSAFIDALIDGMHDQPGRHDPQPMHAGAPPVQRSSSGPDAEERRATVRPHPASREWATGPDAPQATAS